MGEVMCAGENDVGLYGGLEVEGEDFPLEFNAAEREALTCSMVADNLDLCEEDEIWWTCPQACFGGDTDAALTAAPTSAPTAELDCSDDTSLSFDLNGEEANCAYVADQKKADRKSLCTTQVALDVGNRQIKTFCKETCGLVGKGVCKHLKNL